MSTVASLLTAEEFAAMPDEDSFTELVEGQVVRSPLRDCVHGMVCATIAFEIGTHVKGRDLGRGLLASGFITRRNPDSVRGPDVSYYSYERMPRGVVPRGYPEVAPELAVEVTSPDESPDQISARIEEYHAAGVRLVIVISPEHQSVSLFPIHGPNREFSPDDTLTLPELFPHFRVPVRSLFE